MQAGGKLSLGAGLADTPSASRTVRNKSLHFKPPSLLYFVIATQAY